MSPKSTRPLRKSSSVPPAAGVKRGGAADSDGDGTSSAPPAPATTAPRGPAARADAKPGTPATDAEGCPFCNFKHFRVLHGNDLAVALRDEFPVSKGHTLVMSRRHVRSWFAATENERAAMIELIDRIRERLGSADPRPDGYNIGINDGEAAGQTVMHLHVHLIPRYLGDVEDPRGGVRHVIPGRGNYLAPPRRDAPEGEK